MMIISIVFLFEALSLNEVFFFLSADKEDVGSVCQVEMLHRTNLIAVVGKISFD